VNVTPLRIRADGGIDVRVSFSGVSGSNATPTASVSAGATVVAPGTSPTARLRRATGTATDAPTRSTGPSPRGGRNPATTASASPSATPTAAPPATRSWSESRRRGLCQRPAGSPAPSATCSAFPCPTCA
jgi:hypothetical protein